MRKPLLPNEERRAVQVELRMENMGDTPMMRGHAAVFNSPSETLTASASGKQIQFREVIAPGAFTDALKNSDVRALFNHNPDHILGRTSAGTLRMKEDAAGLAIEIDPPDTTCGRDLQTSMGRGDVREMSFGFTVAPGGDKWERSTDGSGVWTRTISKIARLFDVSPVTYPAYPDTECSLRSLPAEAQEVEVPKTDSLDIYRRKLDLESAMGGVERRVNMGYAGCNSLGVCKMCGLTGCMCADCANSACCNMQTAENGGACTKCLKPGCLCLGCPNTDQCKMMQMYSM